jgi:hypothetical protein
MSSFVIVPGAWDRPATAEPVIKPLESAGHEVIIVDLPCDRTGATLEEYADAVRAVLPDNLADAVLVGYSFGASEEAGIAAFDGLILSASPGLCALNIDLCIAEIDTDHGIFREQPERLAELLLAASR